MKFEMNESMVTEIMRVGKHFTPIIPPPGIVRGPIGECFDTCVGNAMLDTRLRYVEGIAMDPYNIRGWIHHAWLTIDGKHAIDPTWKAVISGIEMPVPTIYIGIEMETKAVIEFMKQTEYTSILANGYRAPDLARIALGDKLLKL